MSWSNTPLGELITLQRGHDLPSQKRIDGNIPIMGSSGVTGFHNESKASGPGVVVGRSGNSMGEVSFCEVDFWPLNTCLYVTDFKGNDPRYIYYLLKTIDFDQFNSGSAQKSLNRNAVYPFEVYSTSNKNEQIAIAQHISSLESKAELNNKINQTLEQIAQAIFKSWFVDFEPVKAKITAREALIAEHQTQSGKAPSPQEIAEAEKQAAIAAIAGAGDIIPTAQLQTLADLFPNQLVESDLGEIPEGWELKAIGTQLDVLRGFSYKGKGLVDSPELGVPMHNLNSVLEGGGYKYAGLKYYSENFKDKFEIKEGDVLVANTEQGHNHLLIGYGAMVPSHLAKGFFSHHTYRVRPSEDSNLTAEYIEQLFSKGRFVKQVQGYTNGTTVNMLPMDGLTMPLVTVPPLSLSNMYSNLVIPLKNQCEQNYIENANLEELRNALLPKLLSGEIELTNKE